MFSWVENGGAGWADISPAVRRCTTSRTARIGQALALFGWDKKRWTGWAGRVTHVWLVLGAGWAPSPAFFIPAEQGLQPIPHECLGDP